MTHFKNSIEVNFNAWSTLDDRDNYHEAFDCICRLARLGESSDSATVYGDIFHVLLYRDLRKPNVALKAFDKALKIATDKSLWREQAELFRQKSYLFIQLGKSDDAELLAFESLKISRKLNLKREEADAVACIGYVFEDRRDFQKALSWYQEGIVICDEAELFELKSALLGDIGKVYGVIGCLPESLVFLKQAFKLSVEIKSDKLVILSLYRLGDYYRFIGDKEKAKDFYSEALNKSVNGGFKRDQGDSLYRLGLLEISNHNPDEAVKLLSRSKKIFKKIYLVRQLAYCLIAMGHAAEQQSETIEALEKYLEAFKILPNIFEYTDAYIQIVDNISPLLQKFGDSYHADKLSSLVNELREYTKMSGVFEDFRRKEKIKLLTSKIKDTVDTIQNIRGNIYSHKGLSINFEKIFIQKNGKEIELTDTEWKILNCLWKKKGQVCTKSELKNALDKAPDEITRTIEVHISNIRQKLGKEYIQTITKGGYYLLMK